MNATTLAGWVREPGKTKVSGIRRSNLEDAQFLYGHPDGGHSGCYRRKSPSEIARHNISWARRSNSPRTDSTILGLDRC